MERLFSTRKSVVYFVGNGNDFCSQRKGVREIDRSVL